MQEQSSSQKEAWIGVEISLNERLQEAQKRLAQADEKERLFNEKLANAGRREAAVEAQLTHLKKELKEVSQRSHASCVHLS